MKQAAPDAPLVSVVLPVFNAREFVAEAVESALAQTFVDLEVIVVDDGSNDGSADVLRALAERDSRIHYERQPNRGPARARNRALRLARGKYVAFLDADDLWWPEKLERQVAAAPAGVLYTDAHLLIDGRIQGRISDHVPFARGHIYDALLTKNPVATLTVMAPRTLVERVGGFDEGVPWGVEDFDLWLRLALLDVEFDYLPDALATYRVRPDSLSADMVARSRGALAVYEKLARIAAGEAQVAARAKETEERSILASALRARAWASAERGNERGARDDLREAARLHPLSTRAAIATAAATFPPLLRWISTRRTQTASRALRQ